MVFEEKEITVNGYTFTVESVGEGDNSYSLMYGDVLVLEDSANPDFYGDIDTVADVMADYIQEETEKPFPWFTLQGAYAERGGEPVHIWDDKTAEEWGETINSGEPHELTNESDIKEAKARLGFDDYDDIKHVYSFDGGSFVLDRDL